MVTNPNTMSEIKFYKVGGFVRDQILGIPSKDVDYAVEAPSYEVMRDYIAAHGKIWQERPQYFTIRAKLNGEDCDYVLCRKEGFYSDGRRPDSVEIGTIIDDLSRRDFTCNTIAIDEQGKYIDPFNGQQDLNKHILNCVGNSQDRFSEDSLRLIRAIRFSITRKLRISVDISSCLHNGKLLEKLRNVSIERIREELFKCFEYSTMQTLELLEEYDTLKAILFTDKKLWLVPTIKL